MTTLPPTICLDGVAVRRIREEKKLTQLYVAKVVGVTTDTISRWENNRYPTVRRENVVKLGEALEVEVQLLIRDDSLPPCNQEDPAPPPPPQSHRSSRIRAGVLLFFLSSLVIYLWSLYGRDELPAPDFGGVRILPRFAAPGTVIPVRLRLEIDLTSRGYIVREHFPKGWEIIEAAPPASSIDNQDGMARWIVKQGAPHIDISYLVRVDPRSPAGMIARFHGEIIGNLREKNQVAPIEGDEQATVAPYSWADVDGNSAIDDNEMLVTSQTFEEMQGVHIDWSELERLWDAGGYRLDPSTHRFLPQRQSTDDTPPPPQPSVNRQP